MLTKLPWRALQTSLGTGLPSRAGQMSTSVTKLARRRCVTSLLCSLWMLAALTWDQPAHTTLYTPGTSLTAQVTVALTPNGRADAVTPLPPGRSCSSSDSSVTECFALPAQRRMPFNEFLQLFYSSKTSPSCSQEGGAANRELAAQKQQGQQQGWHQQEEEQKKKQVPRGQQQGKQRQEDQQQQQHEGKARTAERVVPYLQFQNSSLTAELPQLLEDVDEHFPFATEAFGRLLTV